MKLVTLALSFLSFSLGAQNPQISVLGGISEKEIKTFDVLEPRHPPAMPLLLQSYEENWSEWIQVLSQIVFERRMQAYTQDPLSCHFYSFFPYSESSGCVLLTSSQESLLEQALKELVHIRLFGIDQEELNCAKEKAFSLVDDTLDENAPLYLITRYDIEDHLRTFNATLEESYAPTSWVSSMVPTILPCDNEDIYASFYALPISGEEKSDIHYIIHTMAKKNVVKLLSEKKKLQKKGDRINGVHPLRFLGYVFGEGGLRFDMQEVKKSKFKWNNFKDGLYGSLTRQKHQNNLSRFIPGFAQHVGVDQAKVMHYVERGDWDGLMNYLL